MFTLKKFTFVYIQIFMLINNQIFKKLKKSTAYFLFKSYNYLDKGHINKGLKS